MGVVYWQPPVRALEKVKEVIWEPSVGRYGADEGLPKLKEALMQKLGRENNLHKSSVMVTTGANQKIQKAMPFSPLLPLTIVAMATAFRRSPHHKAKR
uniref:Aspartate aminotransferase n=1 Tax=Solanum tuberosum TaxID=4113 RepID=M1DPR6_SOLTU